MLTVLRVVVLSFLVLVVVLWFSADAQGWCTEKWTAVQDQYWEHLTQTAYHIPETARRPPVSMKEFYATRDKTLFAHMLQTRTQHQQIHLGSVMQDGHHADLPANHQWAQGMVVLDPGVSESVTGIKKE